MFTIDNFARSMFEACPQKYYWRTQLGLVPKIKKSMAPYFGIAIHKGLATFYRTQDKVESIKQFALEYDTYYDGEDLARTVLNGKTILEQYFNNYKNDYLETLIVGGQPLIEIGMCLTMPGCNYTGRIDWVAKNKTTDGIYVVDHKTAKYPSSGYNIVKPNNALTGYALGVRELLAHDVEGIMLNLIGTKQKREIDFLRDPTTRSEVDFDRFKHELCEVVGNVERCLKSDFWPRYTGSCASFNGCEYKELCNASAEALEPLMRTLYEVEKWEAFEE